MERPLQNDPPVLSLTWRARSGETAFTLPAGGASVLFGPSASGKTAVLQAVAAARGDPRLDVSLFGEACRRLPASRRLRLARRIGVMFQDLRLEDDLSVVDAIALAARAVGRRRDDYQADLEQLLGWTGLASLAFTRVEDLDLEGRRRTALARALINGPDLLILDEPAAGLAPRARNGLLRLIGEIHAAGGTVLMATRDPGLARACGAQVVLAPGAEPLAELAGAA